MQVYGNISSLKKSIERKYSSQIKAIDKETEKEIEKIKRETEKQIALLKTKMKTSAELEAKKIDSKVMSEVTLKAKRDFEKKREELINKVFDKAHAKAKKVAHSKEYIDYVKKKLPEEEAEAIGDSAYYKKFFPAIKLKIDKNIIGLKFSSANIIYDFTLDSILNSEKDNLRHTISKVLFKND